MTKNIGFAVTVSFLIWLGTAGAQAAVDQSIRSPNGPMPPLAPVDEDMLETRVFRLKETRVDEARIVILGTFVEAGSRPPRIEADPQNLSLRITDTPARLQRLARLISASDKPSTETLIQRRLYEMWVRMNSLPQSREDPAP